jgi:hypothetical protein
MSQLSGTPLYRRWSVILAGVVALAAVAALVGWRGLQQAASGPTTVSPVPSTTVPAPTTAPSTTRPEPTTTRLPPGVLWEETGSDSSQSPLFKAPRRWRITWSFDCSGFAASGGNFKLSGDGAFARVQIQEFDTKASGSQTVTSSGWGSLIVDSVCDRWTVKALIP